MKTTLKKAELSRDDVVALDLLTARQRDILRSVLIGHTNREIADMLGISMRTVEVHRFNLMHILGVRNIAQLFRWALKLGLWSIFPPGLKHHRAENQ